MQRRRGGRRGEDSDVRGPTSALSSFLRERGIRAPRLNPYQRIPDTAIPGATANAAATPPTGADDNPTENAENGQSESAQQQSSSSSSVVANNASSDIPDDAAAETAAVATADASENVDQTSTVRFPAAARGAAKKSKQTPKKKQDENDDDKKKKNPKKRKGKGNDDDDSDQDSADSGDWDVIRAGLSNKIAPRSGHSKRRKTDDGSGSLGAGGVGGMAGDGDSGVRFCRRCLRRFIPEEDEEVCVACATIPVIKGGAGKLAAIKRKKSKLVDEVFDGTVMSLRDMCIKLIAENIDQVEAFGDIPDNVKRAISRILSRRRQINHKTMHLFIGPTEECVEMFDCARLPESALSQVGHFCANVRVLNLSDCGQMTDASLSIFASNLHQLKSLTLKGPFLVTDKAWANLFSSLPSPLEDLFLENAAKLGELGIKALVDLSHKSVEGHSKSGLQRLGLSYCRALTDAALGHLHKLSAASEERASVSNPLTLLELGYLSSGITDEVLIALIQNLGGANLKHLKLIGFPDMTDKVLEEAVATSCPTLSVLSLGHAESLTDEGFTRFLNTWAASTPPLTEVDLTRVIGLGDGAIASFSSLFMSKGGVRKISLNGLDDLTSVGSLRFLLTSGDLVDVDVSFVREFDDELFESAVEANPRLECLRVYGCNRLTEVSLAKRVYNQMGDLVKIIGNEFD